MFQWHQNHKVDLVIWTLIIRPKSLQTNNFFILKKIEEFTSKKSDDIKNNPSSYLYEKSNSPVSDQNIKIKNLKFNESSTKSYQSIDSQEKKQRRSWWNRGMQLSPSYQNKIS